MPERNERGQFKKGHKNVSPGRPPREVEQEYKNIMLSEVTPDDWRLIVRKAKEQAKKGDTQARKWIADYLIGPPIERKEITGADGEPIQFIEILKDAGSELSNSPE